MTRENVITFLKRGTSALDPALPFGIGRISEFNSYRSHEYPTVWVDDSQLINRPTIPPGAIIMDSWNVVMHIAKKDSADSIPEQYVQIVNDCDYIAQQLIKKYNNVVEGYKLSQLTSVSRVPFHKKNEDLCSGVILSFVLVGPDQTNLC